MRRNGVVLIVILAVAMISPMSAQQSATKPEPPTYRVILAVSSNMAQQKISEAAADGYRVLSVIPTEALRSETADETDPKNSPGSGLTIVLRRSDLKQTFDYRLIVLRDAKEFQASLNTCGADGFHLIPSSLQFAWAERNGLDTFLDPETYSSQQTRGSLVRFALMEKTPTDTLKYSYRQVSKVSEVEKLAARGYYPVSGSVQARFIVLEAQTPASSAEPVKLQHAHLAKFDPKAKARPDITVQTTRTVQTAKTPNNDSPAPELDVKLDQNALSGKKLLLVNDGPGVFFSAPVIDVLTASGPPETPPFYRLLVRNDLVSIEQAINEAGSEGLRLFPRIGTAYRVRNQLKGTRVWGVIPSLDTEIKFELQRMMAVMYPSAPGTSFRYRLFSPSSPADLLRKLNAAEADGFRFVSLWRGILILENECRTGALK